MNNILSRIHNEQRSSELNRNSRFTYISQRKQRINGRTKKNTEKDKTGNVRITLRRVRVTVLAVEKTIIIIIIIIIIIGIQPLGRFGQRPELSQATGMALVRCILGKFLGVVCHCFPPENNKY